MEDLTQQINSILGDPQKLQQLQAMAGALGLGGEETQAAAPPPPAPAAVPGMDLNSLQMMTRFAPVLSQLRQEDDSTRLLHALRPLLSEERRQKLDQAVKLLQMLRLLPLLRGSGLF